MEDIVEKESTSIVFSPTIKRIKDRMKNNLYDLLTIVPAEPIIPTDNIVKYTCEFCPKNDKFYVPKKISRLKVKTVRDIRKSFEDDTFTYLPSELERQQNVLLKKIRRGFSRDEETKVIAQKILQSDAPITRPTWQMLTNLNPGQCTYPEQFVIWNGKRIRVNGSKGGNKKYVCNYDLSSKKISLKHVITTRRKVVLKKQGLLRNSLAIKFKPGPLRRKKFLDDSHQKYHVGDTELIKLPKPGLDLYPSLGSSLEPLTYFLNNLRKEDGSISRKWAEFSVSVLGTLEKSDPVLVSNDSVTFNLNYKCDQNRILMRRDDCCIPKVDKSDIAPIELTKTEVVILPEIMAMMNNILDCVEISLDQDNFYTVEDESHKIPFNSIIEDHIHTKEKIKRKYGELDRLDVTVIRIPENIENNITKSCDKPFCSLGCICDSLCNPFHLRGHCGLVDCMFECKCDFSKYKAIDLTNYECSELIPELLNRGGHTKLAKEEQKFHQTVILSGEKSIVLKSEKRSAKAPSKYADYYKSTNLKNDNLKKLSLSIIALKIDCDNIEPWCMVHKLYKCFCKGKFLDTSTFDVKDTVTKESSTSKEKEPESKTDTGASTTVDLNNDFLVPCTCARVNPYVGRKYNDGYYKHTNYKIMSMEKNDTKLRKRMMTIINKILPKENETNCIENSLKDTTKDEGNVVEQTTASTNLHQFLSSVDECLSAKQETGQQTIVTRSKSKRLPNKTKLVAWLEHNYKLYKQGMQKGKTKTSLDPPKLGKVALYPWEFILSRYRERKNLFLISKQKPFRIFMGVNTQNPIFENCININNIGFAELHKYPVTVKNLLTNACDLKDNFCILCGLSDCWELIGSVSKVNDGRDTQKDSSDTDSRDPFDINPTWGDKSSLETKLNDKESFEILIDEEQNSSDSSVVVDKPTANEKSDESLNSSSVQEEKISSVDESATSKWFVMTVENDFSEIRFYKRGFFVKSESIVKAIHVARMSGKTVRLSSQKCLDKSSGPQFGIYAIPNANEYSVFVGPYEIQDSLGIETVNTILDFGKLKRTRGFWITTNKVDNLKVIDNPLSFMKSAQNIKTVSLDSHFASRGEMNLDDKEKDSHESSEDNVPSTSKSPSKKIVKPIKIRKSNGFYHLDSNGILMKKTVVISNDETKINENKESPCEENDSAISRLLKVSKIPYKVVPKPTKADSFTPPKITAIYSVYNEDKNCKTSSETGMLILKPEEINKKISDSNHSINLPSAYSEFKCNVPDQNIKSKERMDEDQKSIEDESECIIVENDNDICVISDDEAPEGTGNDESEKFKEVWIDSTNETLGWIRGRRNSNNYISFQLFGGQFSEFYSEQEIFSKINEALSRATVDLPKENLTWKVVESESELTNKELKPPISNNISFCELQSRPNIVKTYARTRSGATVKLKTIPKPGELLESMGDASDLINTMVNAPEDVKLSMTETLMGILTMGQELDDTLQETP